MSTPNSDLVCLEVPRPGDVLCRCALSPSLSDLLSGKTEEPVLAGDADRTVTVSNASTTCTLADEYFSFLCCSLESSRVSALRCSVVKTKHCPQGKAHERLSRKKKLCGSDQFTVSSGWELKKSKSCSGSLPCRTPIPWLVPKRTRSRRRPRANQLDRLERCPREACPTSCNEAAAAVIYGGGQAYAPGAPVLRGGRRSDVPASQSRRRVAFAPGPLNSSEDGHPPERSRAPPRRESQQSGVTSLTAGNLRLLESLLGSDCRPSIERLRRRLGASRRSQGRGGAGK